MIFFPKKKCIFLDFFFPIGVSGCGTLKLNFNFELNTSKKYHTSLGFNYNHWHKHYSLACMFKLMLHAESDNT